jgi:hypothetical protein
MKEVEPGDLVVGKTYFATNIVFVDNSKPPRQGRWSRQDDLNKKYIVTVSGKRYEPQQNHMDWRIDLKDIKQIRGFGQIMHSNPIPNIDTGGKWTEINVYSGKRGLTLSNFKEEEPKFYERGAQMVVGVSHVVNKTKNKLTKQIRKLHKKLREIDELKLKHSDRSKLNEAEQKKLGKEEMLRTSLIAAEAEEEKKEEEQKSSGGPSTSAFAKVPHEIRGLIQDFGGVQDMGGGRKRKTRRRKRSKTHRRKRSKTRRKRKSRRKRRKSRSRRK